MEEKKFYNIEEIQKYYNEKTNTYVFEEHGLYLNVIFLFDLEINSNIDANNIIAGNITCLNIGASNIQASNIIANRIIAITIFANNVDVKGKIIYLDKITIRFSTRCDGLIYNKLSNW